MAWTPLGHRLDTYGLGTAWTPLAPLGHHWDTNGLAPLEHLSDVWPGHLRPEHHLDRLDMAWTPVAWTQRGHLCYGMDTTPMAWNLVGPYGMDPVAKKTLFGVHRLGSLKQRNNLITHQWLMAGVLLCTRTDG